MIIWLASYPKSGNTWIRTLLTTLLYSNDSKCNFKNLSLIEQYPTKKHYEGFINNFVALVLYARFQLALIIKG